MSDEGFTRKMQEIEGKKGNLTSEKQWKLRIEGFLTRVV
jgi:hypothetical protein